MCWVLRSQFESRPGYPLYILKLIYLLQVFSMVTKKELLEKMSPEQLREIVKAEGVTIKPRARACNSLFFELRARGFILLIYTPVYDV